MLQAVLLPSLAEPQRLEEGSFPGVGIEPLPIQEYRRANYVLSSNRLAAIINTQMADQSASERARMRRVLVYWGDPERAETTEVGGELALAGVSRSIFTAFNLPWIGAQDAGDARPAVADDVVHLPQRVVDEPDAVVATQPIPPETSKTAETQQLSGTPSRKSEGAAASRRKRDLQEQIWNASAKSYGPGA